MNRQLHELIQELNLDKGLTAACAKRIVLTAARIGAEEAMSRPSNRCTCNPIIGGTTVEHQFLADYENIVVPNKAKSLVSNVKFDKPKNTL